MNGKFQNGEPLMRSGAALLALGAAAIHFRQAPAHFEEDVLYGWFFFVVGAAQVLGGLLLFRRWARRFYWVGVVGSLAVMGVWVLTRTVGPPFGADAGVAEQVRIPDLISTAFEGATALLLLGLIASRGLASVVRTKEFSRMQGAGVLGTSFLLVSALTAYSFAMDRPLCTHHRPDYGPLEAIEGHSILPPGTPPVTVKVGESTAVLAGFLINCGNDPVSIERIELLPSSGVSHLGGGEPSDIEFRIGPMTHEHPGEGGERTHVDYGEDLPSSASVGATFDVPRYSVVAVVQPERVGAFAINAVRIHYRYRGRSGVQPFATAVVVQVVERTGGAN